MPFIRTSEKIRQAKKKKSFLYVILALWLATAYINTSFTMNCTATKAKIPANVVPDGISAESAVLIDASSGNVLFRKNADKRMPMASTTKIMTALVAIESCPLDRVVTITRDSVGIEGSSIYLYEGEKLSLENLLYALLLESANDAVTAIAIEVGGSVKGFADMMNARAKALGLKDTSFENPHGLDNENHYTTAYELAVIAAEAMRNENFAKIVSTPKKVIPLDKTEGVRLLVNHNKLLRIYDDAVGIKTGFTKRSGRCLVSAAVKNDVKLIAVTLNAPNDWKDHEAMLDYGFNNYRSVALCERGDFSEPLHLISGTENCVTVSNQSALYATLPINHGEITCTVELPRFAYAPIEGGEKLGKLVYRCDGKIIGECEITAMYDVAAKDYNPGFLKAIKNFLRRIGIIG